MSATSDFYTYISALDTDTFWIVAMMSLQADGYGWTTSEIAEQLKSVGFERETGSTFSPVFINEVLNKLAEKGMVVYGPRTKKDSLDLHPLAARAVRQYLLAYFPEDAYQMGLKFLSRYGGFSRKYPFWQYDIETEKDGIQLYDANSRFVKKILSGLELLEEEFKDDEYISELSRLCGVDGEIETLLAVGVLLPPYPLDFFDRIPAVVRKEVLQLFSRQPYLFHINSHELLWSSLEKYFHKDRELLINAAMHWLPNRPPGSGADFFERFADLEKLSAWIEGRENPGDDTAESLLDQPISSYALLLRARILLKEGIIDASQFSQLVKPTRRMPSKLIEAVSSPVHLKMHKGYPLKAGPDLMEITMLAFGHLWSGEQINNDLTLDQVPYLLDHSNCASMPWLRQQLLQLFSQVISDDNYDKSWEHLFSDISRVPELRLLDGLVTPPSPWEELMAVLESQGLPAKGRLAEVQKNVSIGERRNIFIYNPTVGTLILREQTYGKKGWSSGRKVAWNNVNYQALDERDRAIVPALLNYERRPVADYSLGHWQAVPYTIDVKKAMYLLADHPAVFEDDKKRIPLSVKRGQPQMLVEHNEQGDLEVTFEPDDLEPGYNMRRAGPGQLICYHLDDKNAAIAERIPRGGITIPAFAADRLDQVLPGLKSQIDIQSSTEWMKEDLPQVAGDPKPCFHFVPQANGSHRVEVYVKPLASLDLYFGPGMGTSKHLTATEDEGRMLLVRDLQAETAALSSAKSSCKELADKLGDHLQAVLPDDRHTLAVLTEVKRLSDRGEAEIGYPKGQRLKLVSEIDEDQLAVKISSGKDWFQVDTRLALDEHRVIDFELILEGMRNRDRFIKVGTDEYLSLTDTLRQRLEKMDALLHDNRGKKELSKLAASAFAEVVEGLDQVEMDEEWQDNLNRMTEAQEYKAPPPSPDFKAILRNYQLSGHNWLMRLAHWGVGGCLADDMGLGKTIQALAVLCQRAEEGPTLVIAPASVIRNWRVECDRFAPSLNPRLIASANEAEAILNNLKPFDVVLLSFGLITYIDELLLNVHYTTLVVDEAQAIKNPNTQRARLVRDLQADFKIATTGTPIENNLSELWSLFRFLNPGLFGSYQRFRKHYELPIVRQQNKQRAEQLRLMVRPFILRRKKSEVLKELPPKTEIIRVVEPSVDERSLYEAMRRKALRDIDAADERQRRFLVLQQLTKLRQAACHPKLVNAKSKVASAKMEMVGESIREVLDSGHKVLVFSQFVKHLKLVEDWVKNEHISYQYLDGSTPAKVRQLRVEAFQKGEGELFLISLKAGGTGLNLTAADYVFHLDPWWNPAAEDQASDRAHRIGQQRPVTVYRFITAGTIEEQIIELHASKRDLADQLLSHADGGTKLSVDEIVSMLKSQ